jgi:ArsR family transcriptional regulator
MSEITQFTVEFFKVLADQTRLQILDLLKESEITQKDIEEALGISQSTISQHLKTLISSNLISFERKENKNFYRIKNVDFFNLINDIRYFVVRLNKEKQSGLENIDVLDTLF